EVHFLTNYSRGLVPSEFFGKEKREQFCASPFSFPAKAAKFSLNPLPRSFRKAKPMSSSRHRSKRNTHLLGTPLVALVITLFAFGVARAQIGGGLDPTGTGGQHSIHGRIYYPSGRRSDKRVMVKLETYNSGELSVMSDANGSFTFSGLIPGNY